MGRLVVAQGFDFAAALHSEFYCALAKCGVDSIQPMQRVHRMTYTASGYLKESSGKEEEADLPLLREATQHPEEYLASARIFCRMGASKVAEAYTVVTTSDEEDVALYCRA